MKPVRLPIAAVFLLAVFATHNAYAIAFPVFQSEVRITGGNLDATGQATYTSQDIVPGSFESGTGVASKAGSESFSGIDDNGDSATMTLTFDAEAQAEATGLKSKASGSLADAFYNASNEPFFEGTGFVDPNGVPIVFSIASNARMADVLAVSGGAGLSYITASLGIEGSTQGKFSADNFVGGAVAQVYQTAPSFGLLWGTSFSDTLTDYDETITSNQISVSGGEAIVGLRLDTRIDITLDPAYLPFDALYEGVADFFGTLTIDSFAGFDASGNPVDLESVTGSGGQQYTTVRVTTPPPTIPAPGVLALMGLGLVGLKLSRGRRKSH